MHNQIEKDNMSDDANLDIAEAEEQMQQLPFLSAENLYEVRRRKEIIIEQLRGIRQATEELTKRSNDFVNKINLMKEKLRQVFALESKLKEDKELALRNLTNIEETASAVDMELLKYTHQLRGFVADFAIEIFQNFKEYKSIECLENGTNTMIYRSEELMKQIRSLENGIDYYTTKLEQKVKQSNN